MLRNTVSLSRVRDADSRRSASRGHRQPRCRSIARSSALLRVHSDLIGQTNRVVGQTSRASCSARATVARPQRQALRCPLPRENNATPTENHGETAWREGCFVPDVSFASGHAEQRVILYYQILISSDFERCARHGISR
jgi:hypothetical protein